MVRTGKRAAALSMLLEAGGLTRDETKKAAPRLEDLDTSIGNDVLRLYRALGGVLEFRNSDQEPGISAWAAS